jgi:hypothetical protein
VNLELVERIVNAVLYEGYILYPYRPSAMKNRQRWNFGALVPQSYSEAQQGTDICRMQTECLVQASQYTTLNIKARFLHLTARDVGKLDLSLSELPDETEPDFQTVASLNVDDQVFHTWQEAIERDVSSPSLNLKELAAQPQRLKFDFTAKQEREPLKDSDGRIAGAFIRNQRCVGGAVEISAEPVADQLFKLRVEISNLTRAEEADLKDRDEALMRSLVSTHAILNVQDGGFVSLLDPPEGLRELAASCQNIGCWPVLVGEAGDCDCMLASPIILYDYPQVAPESVGDLFDSTEIDELLMLRIMTLTDEEKLEMCAVDERARQILERTEKFGLEHMTRLHGAVRGLRLLKEENQ